MLHLSMVALTKKMKKIFAVIILIICFVGVSILYCANYVIKK